MSEPLRPCPWPDCGGEARVTGCDSSRGPEYWVACAAGDDCEAQGPIRLSEAEAVTCWNALPRPEGVAEFLAAFDAWAALDEAATPDVVGAALTVAMLEARKGVKL